ncbi:MAG: TatD family hydrolase [Bacteroidales bacterium]|nr:TatD family hydrolase [Bacteroidales bacterium]
MQIIDTHCHMYDEAFGTDRAEAVQRAIDAGVTTVLLPAIDSQSVAALEALYNSNPAVFRKMTGLHPTSVKENFWEELNLVEGLLSDSPDDYVAVGEIGLDFYWDDTFRAQQIEALEYQFDMASRFHKPVALHVRKAYNEMFEALKKHPALSGVFHCFGSSVQEARKAIDMGFYIGVGGVVTFKNATLADVVRQIPLERILIETDAPYLAPVPYRGKRNESAYCTLVAQKIAELKGVDFEIVAEVTTNNAKSLFKL